MKLLMIIDNTLAENEHRVYLLPNWEKFYHACDLDEVITPMLEAVKPYLHHPLIEPIFVTGRTGFPEVKSKTKKWLSDCGIENPIVHYRGLKDFSKSHVFKEKVLNKEKQSYHNKVIIDDDSKITEHFSSLGHYCVLVNKDNDYCDTVNDIKHNIDSILEYLTVAQRQTIISQNYNK